jgi:hypothetical protein
MPRRRFKPISISRPRLAIWCRDRLPRRVSRPSWRLGERLRELSEGTCAARGARTREPTSRWARPLGRCGAASADRRAAWPVGRSIPEPAVQAASARDCGERGDRRLPARRPASRRPPLDPGPATASLPILTRTPPAIAQPRAPVKSRTMLLARARDARYGPDWAFHRIAKSLSSLSAPGEDERSRV